MRKLRNEKGAITMITLVTIVFMVSFLMTSYALIANKVKTQKEILAETKAIYEPKLSMEEIYNSYYVNDNIIPISTVEQLLSIGSNEKISIDGKVYTFSNTEDSIYLLKNDLEFSAIELDLESNWVPPYENEDFVADFDWSGHTIKVTKLSGDIIIYDGIYLSTANGKIINTKDAVRSNLVDYRIYGNSIQKTTTEGNNLCPPVTDSRWVLENGAYINENGYLVLPNENSKATVSIDWNKRSSYMMVRATIPTGGNYHLTTSYIDENGTVFPGNGAAGRDAGNNILVGQQFGTTSPYNEYIANAKTVKLSFIRSTSYAVNEYTVTNVMLSPNNVAYEDYAPNSPTPEYPSEIQSVGDKTKNLFNINDTEKYYGGLTCKVINDVITLESTETLGSQMAVNYVKKLDSAKQYTISFKGKKLVGGGEASWIYVAYYGSNDGENYELITYTRQTSPTIGLEYKFSHTLTGYSNYKFYIYNYVAANAPIGEKTEYYDIQLEEGNVATSYEPYGYKIPIKVSTTKNYDKTKYNIIGNSVIVKDGIASNFSDSSYIDTGYKFSPGNNTWEYGVKIKTGTAFPWCGIVGSVGGSNGCTPFYMDGTGYWIAYLSSTGSSWDIASATPIMQLNTNTTYWLKVQFTGTQYIFSYSLDGVEWKIARKLDSTLKIYNGLTVHLGNNRGNNSPFNGEIDLSSFYIKINGKYDFNGSSVESKTFNIYLDEPLRKIGDVSDYIDFKNKKVIRNIGHIYFTGEEDWVNQVVGNYTACSILKTSIRTNATILPAESINILSNYFGVSKYENSTSIGKVYSGNYYINFNLDDINSVSTFKSWLSKKYTDGNPLLLEYLIPSTEQTIELPNISLYRGKNIITVDTEVQPSDISITYNTRK